jgi:GDSL-like Lipase/Acylhydrolase family
VSRYVALGSSMAAGPGIRPKAPHAPFGSGRSAVNYAHLVADRRGYDLVDVTFSGATTAHVLTDRQRKARPQIEAIDAAGLPRLLRSLPGVGPRLRDQLDPAARDTALAQVAESLIGVGHEVRRRAPRARVLFVDYLTLLPPAGTPALPLSAADVALARHVGDTLKQFTEDAAAAAGCELVRASDASVDHHPWSNQPWATRLGLPLPGRPAPLHPNAAGMRAVADLVVAALT